MNEEQAISFVRLARKFFRSDLWNESREFSRAEAWLDMIATATLAPETRLVEGRCVSLHRGELVASLRYLACRWSWSKSRVDRYLSGLCDAGRITKRDANGTGMSVITLCKYAIYNPTRDTHGTDTSPPARQQRDKVKEREEVKNLKREGDALRPTRPSFARPSREELNLYAAKIGLPASEVARFVNYYESNGWRVGRNPMRSWQHAMVNWKLRGEERNGHHLATSNAYALKAQAQAVEDLIRRIRNRGVEDAFGWRAANEEDRKRHRELQLKLKELREKMAAMES